MKSNHTITLSIAAISALLLLSSCASPITKNPQNAFFDTLSSLCGERFEGVMTFPTEGQDSFANKKLIAKFDSCNNEYVKIPFAVGDDTSRTWVITQRASGLELKHDHRHADGTPDDINLYGGSTQNSGSALSQSFFADDHTKKLIPNASTNVWTISFNANKTELKYHLERHQRPRFTAKLQLVKE